MRKTVINRILTIVLTLAMIMPAIVLKSTQVNAQEKTEAITITEEEIDFAATNYRRIIIGEKYNFNLVNKTAGSKYKWTSSKPDIVKVSKRGIVTALSKGAATITCRITNNGQHKYLKAKVYVFRPSKKASTGITINNKISSMVPLESYDLNVSYLPEKASDYVTWISSDRSIAIVNRYGVVTAKAAGQVKITACSINGKKKDSVSIMISDSPIASSQEDINRFVKNRNITELRIETDEDVELEIPRGDYTPMMLRVNCPNGTIINKGVFDNIVIDDVKDGSFIQSAVAKNIVINDKSLVFKLDSGYSIAKLTINGEDSNVKFECLGECNLEVMSKATLSISGSNKAESLTVNMKAADSKLILNSPATVDIEAKVTLQIADALALNSEITVSSEDVKPNIIPISEKQKNINITINGKQFVVNAKGEFKEAVNPPVVGQNTSGGGSSYVNPDRIRVDANGFDSEGRVVAYFGSPDVDGEIDDIWKQAERVKFSKTSYKNPYMDTDTSATLKVLWDDNAIYYLAEVRDSNLSINSPNVHENDSVDFLLDQDNKGAGVFDDDDFCFTVNYKNEQSYTHGDLMNLYSAAKEVAGGYVIEGRVALNIKPDNDIVMGMEASVNDAVGSDLCAVFNVFDETGSAYWDTSKFGEMVLTGKKEGSVTKPNFYDLKSLVKSAKDIELVRYINGATVTAAITEAEAAVDARTSTQERYDELYVNLKTAIDNLMHNTLSFDEKECRDIPSSYRQDTSESIRGKIEYIEYKTNTYDENAIELTKNMLVYLPHGYSQEDKVKKYNVLYLLHGATENQNTIFGGVGQNTEFMRVVDNMIADGKLEPMIIVTPTWYNGTENEDSLFSIKNFHNELIKDIIPTIEGAFNVYAKSTKEEDLIAARNHRAVGGFSMGSACTWYNYIYSLDYFKYYVPISLWCWQNVYDIKAEGYDLSGNNDEIIAQYLARKAKDASYTKDDIRIFCATGTKDLAYGGMNSQIAEMKKLNDIFVYSADLRKGNFYYITQPEGTHDWRYAHRYLYNILPDLFREYWTDDYGLTNDGAATASFGSPVIDGEVDTVWSEARKITPKYISTPENTKASFRVMWDDKALYVLAQVKDENVTKESTNPYEQDSLEIFLDEKNDKSEDYGLDDIHFRINYDNSRTADKGDIKRLYSKTSRTGDGYIIEARIAWESVTLENDDVFGLELMINDAKEKSRVGTIGVFDDTNNAWQNTGLFGSLVIKGKMPDSVSPVDIYTLLLVIEEAEKLSKVEYSNPEVLDKAIEEAKKMIADKTATQEQIDAIVTKIENMLAGKGELVCIKRFIPFPSEMKAECVSSGSIKTLEYQYTKDGSEKTATKRLNIYLPYGYDSESDKQYNVLYLMHGGGENEDTVLVPTEYMKSIHEEKEFKLILDNMIASGKMEPMIVVCPTTNDGEGSEDTFYKELITTIIPKVESTYHTYAYEKVVALTMEKIMNTREHRAFGGFSMGSLCTWNVLTGDMNDGTYGIDYFKYFVPLSGESRATDTSVAAAKYIEDIIITREYNSIDGFKLFCATGSDDIAYPNMNPLMEEIKKLNSTFIFDQDTSKGNTYFMVAEGGTHDWKFIYQYLYCIMPDLFK